MVRSSVARQDEASGGDSIVTPFAQTTSTVRRDDQRLRGMSALWIVSMLLAVVVFGNVGYFAYRYITNPYRTLPQFSVDRYLADFQPLTGTKFRADFRVEADLGWKANFGRLMAFTAIDDTRPILVLIPPKLAGIFFSKGQTYQLAVEVGDGGLIYADSCDKE